MFQNQRYDCQKAQRRFLQMPLVSVNVAGGVYLCEKKDEVDFDSLKNEIIRNLPTQSKTILMSKEEFNKILDTTESEAERNRLKHTIASAYNLSRRQASSLYNIARMQKRATDISEASQKVREIYEMHNYLAKIEQRAFLISHRVNFDSYIQTSSSESESESEDDEADSIASEECQNVNENSLDTYTLDIENIPTEFTSCCEQNYVGNECSDSHEQIYVQCSQKQNISASKEHFDLNFGLHVLKEVEFNRFALVEVLKTKFEIMGRSSDSLDQYIMDLTLALPNSDLYQGGN